MPRWTLFIIIQASIIGLDRLTKILARHYLQGAGRLSYAWDTFRLEYSENSGAFLSLGSNLSPNLRFLVVTGLSGLLLLGLAIVLMSSPSLSRAEFILLSFILAGGVSNMIDRIFNDGHVEDFLNVGIGWLRTGIFNVADMAITGGVIVAVFSMFVRGPDSKEEPATAADNPTELRDTVETSDDVPSQERGISDGTV